MRQLVTESLALAIVGGAAGIALASVFHGALVRMIAQSDPRFDLSFGLNREVFAFAAAATLAAVALFGVLPAWQVTRTDASAALNEQRRTTSGSRHQTRSGQVLVSLQLALSLPLLVGAGLLARTVFNLQRADIGFPADRLLLVRVDLGEAIPDPARRDGARRALLDEIRRLPGVRAATFSQLGVFSGGESSAAVQVEGYVPKTDRDRPSARDMVGPNYFTTLGVPVIAGREILEKDRQDAPRVCVINEALARRFFEHRNPIGMHLTSEDEEGRMRCEVVGVARNARTQALRGDIVPRYFLAAAQPPSVADSPTFLIRPSSDSAAIMAAVRETIRRAAGPPRIVSASSLDEEMRPLIAQDRATAQLAVVFASVALALGAIGLYGVLSYGVARRTGEIAIRIALGARPTRVVAVILRETVALVLVGLALGGALSDVASRLTENRLYGVAPHDPATIAFAAGLLLSAALAAAYIPARRASRLDPIAALRQG